MVRGEFLYLNIITPVESNTALQIVLLDTRYILHPHYEVEFQSFNKLQLSQSNIQSSAKPKKKNSGFPEVIADSPISGNLEPKNLQKRL